ncbi:hypothetical protein [Gemmata sp.]|uniref:hypothetical protein n=1 Tax=Gemmata sp. TaxID=1914242 RepID=UPI003F723EC1
MSTRGIRAGRAFVELVADSNQLYRALDQASARLKKFGSAAVSIGAKSAAAGGAVLAPLGKAFSDALTKGADIKAIAARYQQGVGSISELVGAFEFAGVGVREFGDVVGGLEGKIIAAADANGELIEGLRGLRGRDLIGKSLDQQLDRIFKRFGDINASDFDLANQAEQIFGAAGAKLVPYLKDGIEGLRRLKAEGKRTGAVMSVEDIERAHAASKAWDAVMVELATTIVKVGSALLPATDQTKELSEQVRDVFAAGREWVANNGEIIATIAKVAGGVAAAGIVLAGIGTSVKLLGPIFSGAVSGIRGIVGGFALLKSPIGALGFAVGGLGALWLTCTENGRAAAADLGKAFRSIGDTFRDTWGGITAAVGKGDLATAFKLAGTGIKAVWFELIISLGKAFAAFIEDNRKKLLVLAALSGGSKGGRLGSVLGPYGTAAGAIVGAGGAALATDALLDELKDIGHNPKMEAALAQAKKDIKELVAKAKAPGGGAGVDDAIRKAAELEKARFDGYANRARDGAQETLTLGSRQRGIFSGPVQQQLGYSDQMAKRQLDVQMGIKNGVEKVANKVEDLGKHVAVFKR